MTATHCVFCANKLDALGRCPCCPSFKEIAEQLRLILGGVEVSRELWTHLGNEISIVDRLLEDPELQVQNAFGDLVAGLTKLREYAEGRALEEGNKE